MAAFDFRSSPADRQLRQFGAVCLVALPLLAWSLCRSFEIFWWAGIPGLLFFVTGVIEPKLLRPVYRALTVVTLPVGLIAGEALMLLIFFGLFLPVSVVFRIAGHDFRGRRNQWNADTSWRERKTSSSVGRYFHQF